MGRRFDFEHAARCLAAYGIQLLPRAKKRRRRRARQQPLRVGLLREYLPSRREIDEGTAAVRRGWSRQREAARRTRVPFDLWLDSRRQDMLVLARKVGQRIQIGRDVTICIVRIGGGAVRIGIEAPKSIPIVRDDARPAPPDPSR